MDSAAIIILCTAPDAAVAAELARGLVEQKLAACVNVIPGLRSYYVWEGKLEDDAEVQMLVKTRREHFEAVAGWLGEHHPYDEPEVLALPITQGSRSYLDWLAEQTER